MTELTKLVEALTDLAVEATKYLRTQNPASQQDKLEAIAEQPKVRKPRAPKEEPAVLAAPPVATPAAPEMTEAQSLAEALSVAKAYVERFSKADGLNRARAILREKFNATQIPQLVHSQRLQFVSHLKQEMAEAA